MRAHEMMATPQEVIMVMCSGRTQKSHIRHPACVRCQQISVQQTLLL